MSAESAAPSVLAMDLFLNPCFQNQDWFHFSRYRHITDWMNVSRPN